MAMKMIKDNEPTRIKTRLKVGDEVVVISGRNKKSVGKLLAMDLKRGRVIVQGVNMRKRFTRPTQENPRGGEVEIESPLHISNVQYYDAKEKAGTRLKAGQGKGGEKTRVSVKSGKELA